MLLKLCVNEWMYLRLVKMIVGFMVLISEVLMFVCYSLLLVGCFLGMVKWMYWLLFCLMIF